MAEQGIQTAINDTNRILNQMLTTGSASATAAAASASAAAGSATAAAASATAASASATAAAASATAAAAINFGHLGGLGLSNVSGTVLGIAAGAAANSTNTVTITLGAFTKSTGGTWVAGSGNNGMGAALTIAASTWYHAFAIINGGTPDAYFDTSPSAANAPGGTTAFRRLGSFKTDGSSNILAFSQNADRFDWGVPIQELNAIPVGTSSAVTQTMIGVPLGIVTQALISGRAVEPGGAIVNTFLYLSSLAQTAAPPTVNAFTTQTGATGTPAIIAAQVQTNTSQQIRFQLSTATCNLVLITNGWIDTRGRG